LGCALDQPLVEVEEWPPGVHHHTAAATLDCVGGSAKLAQLGFWVELR
jgi:hypothetical protein